MLEWAAGDRADFPRLGVGREAVVARLALVKMRRVG